MFFGSIYGDSIDTMSPWSGRYLSGSAGISVGKSRVDFKLTPENGVTIVLKLTKSQLLVIEAYLLAIQGSPRFLYRHG